MDERTFFKVIVDKIYKHVVPFSEASGSLKLCEAEKHIIKIDLSFVEQ